MESGCSHQRGNITYQIPILAGSPLPLWAIRTTTTREWQLEIRNKDGGSGEAEVGFSKIID